MQKAHGGLDFKTFTDHLRSSEKQLAWGHEPPMHQILNLQLSSNFTEAGLQINFVNFNLKRPINKMQAAGSRKRKFQRFGFDDTNTIRGACGALPTQFFFLHNPHNTPKSYHETK